MYWVCLELSSILKMTTNLKPHLYVELLDIQFCHLFYILAINREFHHLYSVRQMACRTFKIIATFGLADKVPDFNLIENPWDCLGTTNLMS